MRPPRVIILNDWLTPYRIPLYARLAKDFPELTVLFCTERIREYQWNLPEDLPFRSALLPRIELRLRRPPYNAPRIIFVNPTLLLRLIQYAPDVLVSFAFSIPTWTALAYASLTRTPLLSWLNDTLHTERHLGRLQRLSRRIVIPRAAACITASEQSREKYLAYGARPDRVYKVLQAPDTDCDRGLRSMRPDLRDACPPSQSVVRIRSRPEMQSRWKPRRPAMRRRSG